MELTMGDDLLADAINYEASARSDNAPAAR